MSRTLGNLWVDMAAPPSAPPTLHQAIAIDPNAAAKSQAAYTASITAYQQAIAKLSPSWTPLPTAPYPPSGDNSTFPRTGTPSLIVNAASVSALQLAEPAAVTKNLYDQSVARRPKLSPLFFVGAACLVGYFIVR